MPPEAGSSKEFIMVEQGGHQERLLSRFEITRVISARALQIAQGSPTYLEPPKGMIDPLEIAKLEWEKGLIPIEARKRVSY